VKFKPQTPLREITQAPNKFIAFFLFASNSRSSLVSKNVLDIGDMKYFPTGSPIGLGIQVLMLPNLFLASSGYRLRKTDKREFHSTNVQMYITTMEIK